MMEKGDVEIVYEEQFDTNGVDTNKSSVASHNRLNEVCTEVIEFLCHSYVHTRDIINATLVLLNSLDLCGSIEGVDPNVDPQEQMKHFWNLHVKTFSQYTAEHCDLTFLSNSSSSMSATRNTIQPKPMQY